jgi:hypothetical protein
LAKCIFSDSMLCRSLTRRVSFGGTIQFDCEN